MPESDASDTSDQPKTLEVLLSALPETERAVVLAQVDKARKEAAGYRAKLRDVEPLAAKARELEEAQKTAEQKAKDVATQAETRANTFRDRAVKAEVRGFASADFADPEDAAAFLNPGDYVDETGEVDSERIKKDLADLLQRKPHLARVTGTPGVKRDRTQGTSSAAPVATSPEETFASWWRSTAT